MKTTSGKPACPDWEFDGRHGYTKNGWTVWTTGAEWKIRRPDGFVYAVSYMGMVSAMKFAERKMGK